MSFIAPLKAFVVFVSYAGPSSFASSPSLVWLTAAWTVRNSEGEKRFCSASELDEACVGAATAGDAAMFGLLTSRMTDGVTGGGGLRLSARLAGDAGRDLGRAGRGDEAADRARGWRDGDDGAERTRLLASAKAPPAGMSTFERGVGLENLPARLGGMFDEENEGGSCKSGANGERVPVLAHEPPQSLHKRFQKEKPSLTGAKSACGSLARAGKPSLGSKASSTPMCATCLNPVGLPMDILALLALPFLRLEACSGGRIAASVEYGGRDCEGGAAPRGSVST